jgi:hypothetical protein
MSSSPIRRSTRVSKLTEKLLANAPSRTADSPPSDSHKDTDLASKANAMAQNDPKVTVPNKRLAASSATPQKKKAKVGYKKSRTVPAKQKGKKKTNADDNDEDYKDADSEPGDVDDILALIDSKDNDAEEDDEDVSADGGDRYV